VLGNPDRPVGGLAVRTPPGVELRPLGRDDLAVATALAREARDLPATPQGELIADRYERLLNDPDVAPFLAVAAGDPAGIGVIQFRRRLNFATFEGWMSELWARPGDGAEAIRQALAEAMVAEWRLRQGHRLLVEVEIGDEARLRTVQALGAEPWMIDYCLAPVSVPVLPLPDGVSLRPVGVDDGDAVTRLIAEFGPQRSPVPDRMEAVLRTFAAHARSVAAGTAGSAVAVLEDVVVGVCTLEWRRPFWDDRLVAWIPDLVVTEPVRGRGIGRALLASALELVAERGAAEAVLESGPNRASAHALYDALGFERTGRTHVLRRDDP
jgi:ribosomal protein S18 acetylase RimI-like enzyme